MSQMPTFRCDACGLPILPQSEDCPRCGYPVKLPKEIHFLQQSIHDLQRVATYGGSGLTVPQLMERYRRRLAYLLQVQALSVQTPSVQSHPQPGQQQAVSPSAQPVQPSVQQSSEKADVPIQPARPRTPTLRSEVIAFGSEVLPDANTVRPPAPSVQAQKRPSSPAPVVQSVQASSIPPTPVASQRFSFSWRSFFIDQAIMIIGLLGAFIILMGALSAVFTTTPLQSFLIVFGVHAFFGLAGVLAFRFAQYRLLARIYTGIYAFLVPLVGFTGYGLIQGNTVHLTVETLIVIAASYAAVVYMLLAIYQRFPLFGYLGVAALIVADLALARDLHLPIYWWPSMVMLLAFPALLAISTRKDCLPGSFALLRDPVRIFMFLIVALAIAGSICLLLYSLSLDTIARSSTEIRLALFGINSLLFVWTCLFLWVTEHRQSIAVLAYLWLACVLSVCYAFAVSSGGYVLAFVLIALLYHALSRWGSRLLQSFGDTQNHLERLALVLACLIPVVGSLLLPLQLLFSAYHWHLRTDIPAFFLIQPDWNGWAELVAVVVASLIIVDATLFRARQTKASTQGYGAWPWLLVLSGVLLTYAWSIIVLLAGFVPVWSFLGITLLFVAVAVIVHRLAGSAWSFPLDVVALVCAGGTLVLGLLLDSPSQLVILFFFTALSYAMVLYQRLVYWLFLPILFALLALPALGQQLSVMLLAGLLLPFAGVAIHEGMRRWSHADTSVSWELPAIIIALVYQVSIASLDIVWQTQTVAESLFHVAFPVALELTLFACTWYAVAALTQLRWLLVPTVVFAIIALLIPSNPLWVLICLIPLATFTALSLRWKVERVWALPLYVVAGLSVVMVGIDGYRDQQLLLVSSALLGSGLLAYIVGLVEDEVACLWLMPLLASWSFCYSLVIQDFYRFPLVVLIATVLGVGVACLRFISLPFIGNNQGSSFRSYTLPFYVTALAAGLFTGLYGLSVPAGPFYTSVPDVLLLYAAVAFGLAVFEDEASMLWLVVAFGAWAIFFSFTTHIAYVVSVGLSLGIAGMLVGRFVRRPALKLSISSGTWSWGLPWYAVSLVAACMTGSWPLLLPLAPLPQTFVDYALFAFAVMFYSIGLVERKPLAVWIAPVLATWALLYVTWRDDVVFLLVVSLTCVAMALVMSRLKCRFAMISSPAFSLSLYVSACMAVLLLGWDGTFSSPDVNVRFIPFILLAYAGIACAVAIFEKRATWLLLVAGFGVWATLLLTRTTAYDVAGVMFGAGIVGLLVGRAFPALPTHRLTTTLRPYIKVTWGWPWYVVMLVAALVIGVWPVLPAAVPVAHFVAYALLAFAIFVFLIGMLEVSSGLLWIMPVFALWASTEFAVSHQFYALAAVALISAIVGGATLALKYVLPDRYRLSHLAYAVPLYTTALGAALLTGIAFSGDANHPFYAAIPLTFFLYALVTWGLLRLERYPIASFLVALFAIWAAVLLIQTRLEYELAAVFITAGLGALCGRIVKRPVLQGIHPSLARFTWSGAWYLSMLAALLLVVSWQHWGAIPGVMVYGLLMCTLVVFGIMLVERTPEAVLLVAGVAVWTIWKWEPHLSLAGLMLAYSLVCVAIFASQYIWRVLPSASTWLSVRGFYSGLAFLGQCAVLLTIMAHGGLSAYSGSLAFVGAGALFVLAVLLCWYGYIQPLPVTRRWCNYGAGLIVALSVSWLLRAFGQTNLDVLTLAPATYLIVIAPLLMHDTTLPSYRTVGQTVAVLGTLLLLLPTLWLSFNASQHDLLYTLILLGEALVLLLLGIGTGMRVFVLAGAGLVVLGAIHAIFLPSLGIPTPLALTILGVMLLAVATGLSLVRQRLRMAWSNWE